MSQRPNQKMIGAFVLGATALLVGAVLYLGRAKIWTPTREFVLFFDGAVTGLSEGSPVVFRGVPVGAVKTIHLECDVDDLSLRVPVVIEVEPRRVRVIGGALDSHDIRLLVDQGLRAQLELQSIVTGQLMVSFDLYPDAPINLSGLERDIPELPTIPNRLQRLTRTIDQLPLDEIVQRTARALEGIEAVINSEALRASGRSLQQSVDQVAELVRRLNGRIDPVADDLQATLRELRTLSRDWSGYGARMADSVEATAGEARAALSTAEEGVARVGGELEQTLAAGRSVLRTTDERVGPAADSVNRAALRTEAFVAGLDRDLPGVVERLDGAVATARQALEATRGAAVAAEDLVGNDSILRYELSNALREVAAAARSLRILADTLERQPDALLRGKGGNGTR